LSAERIERSTIDATRTGSIESLCAGAIGRDNVISVGTRSRAKYAIRAVVFQEGDWLCAQCLEYDLVARAKSLQQVSRALQLLIAGHVAVRLRHEQQPFRDLPRAPEKYWTMFRRSRLALPAPMFKLDSLRSQGVVVAPPEIRVAAPSAA
jgi:hypothetical protein